MSFLPMKTPNPLLPPKSPLENGYDLLRLFLGLGPLPRTGFPPAPGYGRPDMGGCFGTGGIGSPGQPLSDCLGKGSGQRPPLPGLLFDPSMGIGLLGVPFFDPGPRPFSGGNAPASAPPAFGAWGAGPSFANPPQQVSESAKRAASASLSNSALPPSRIAPEPRERNTLPPFPSNPYAQNGLGSGIGSDWRDEFSAAAFGRTPSPFGQAAANVFDPQRGRPPFNPPPADREYPDFQRVADAAQGQGGNVANSPKRPRIIVDTEALPDAGHKEKFAYSVIGQAEGDRPDTSTPSDNPPVTGISQKLVRELASKIKGIDPDMRPDRLTPQQRAQIFRAFFDRELSDALGHETLEYIDHKGVAAFVADTVFREGAKGNRMIQEAINSVLDEQRQRGIDVDMIRANGRFNMETLYALNKIVENGDYRQRLLREIKLRRDEIHTDPRTWKGEAFRTQHVYELGTAKDR